MSQAASPTKATLWITTLCAIAVTISACSGVPPKSPETPADQAESNTPTDEPDPTITTTCAMLSIVESTTDNALVGAGPGETLSTEQFATIVNEIPHTLVVIQRVSTGLNDDVTELIEAVKETPPTAEGATFNPDGLPYREVFQGLRDSCEANGSGIAAIPNRSGG